MSITSNLHEQTVQQPFNEYKINRSMSDVSVVYPLYSPDLARIFLLYDLFRQNSPDDPDFKGETW